MSDWPAVGQPYILDFKMRLSNGSVVASPAGLSARLSTGSTESATTNAPTVNDATYGACSLVLTAAEMTARTLVTITSSTPDTVPVVVGLVPSFNPATDPVARVTLVDTTTVNTDMRGTNGANTVAPATPTDVTNARDAILAGGTDTDTLINHLTKLDAEGNIDPTGTALGVASAGSKLALYLSTDTTHADAIRVTTAATDGTWALYAAAGTYMLVVTKDKHYDAADGDSAITRTVVIT